MPLHHKVHDDAVAGRNRIGGLPSVTGDWEVFAKGTSGGPAGAMKCIARVFHVVDLKCSFQATFIERTVVGYKRKSVYLWRNFFPYFRECRSMCRIIKYQTMYLGVPVTVVIGVRTYQPINLVDDFPSFTMTIPTLHMLERSLLAVSKSIAAKFSIKIFCF